MRWAIAPFFVAFSFVDVIYQPERAPLWLGLRVGFLAFIWLVFREMARSRRWRKRGLELGTLATLLASSSVNFMIYDSGNDPVYVAGLFLCATSGIQLFKLPTRYALVAQLGTYLPAIWLLASSLYAHSWVNPVVHIALMVGMILLSFVNGKSDEQELADWVKAHSSARSEIERHRRTELFKKYMPESIRREFESGTMKFEKQKVVERAVVGFADIVSSTEIANSVDLQTEWLLKESFLIAATKRANEHDVIVLTHLGDGFLFLANYRDSSAGSANIVAFYEHLTRDFKAILEELAPRTGPIVSGLRFGVACGPTLVGWLGENQAYFTAIGPEVNLAARLCRKAGLNELVASARGWEALGELPETWSSEHRTYRLKGFKLRVTAKLLRSSHSSGAAGASVLTLVREGA